jgi:hypothetical protein
MARSIEIDDEVYEQLKLAAEPFVDTPNSVLRRVLGLDGEGSGLAAVAPSTSPDEAVSAPVIRPRKLRQRPSRGAVKQREQPRKRVPAGSILPEAEYELPLLQALIDAGGEGPSKEITEAVGKKLASRLTDFDREALKSGGIRWENRIQFVRLKLIQRGFVVKDTPRGIWAISDAGRRYIEQSK